MADAKRQRKTVTDEAKKRKGESDRARSWTRMNIWQDFAGENSGLRVQREEGLFAVGLVSIVLVPSFMPDLLHFVVYSSHYLFIMNPFSLTQQSFSQQSCHSLMLVALLSPKAFAMLRCCYLLEFRAMVGQTLTVAQQNVYIPTHIMPNRLWCNCMP